MAIYFSILQERSTKQPLAAQQNGTPQGNATTTTPAPATPATPGSPHAQQPPYTLTIIAKAGYRTLTSKKEKKKKRRRAASAGRKRAPSPASNRLLLWLVISTMAWLAFEWIRVRILTHSLGDRVLLY